MDVELASVITAVSKNKSIKHLHMGRNLINMKAKHVSAVMEALVQMIQVFFFLNDILKFLIIFILIFFYIMFLTIVFLLF